MGDGVVDVVGVVRTFDDVAHEGAEGEDGGRADFRHVVVKEFEELLVGVVADAHPFGGRVFVPDLINRYIL